MDDVTQQPSDASELQGDQVRLARGTGTFDHVARLARVLFAGAEASVLTDDDAPVDRPAAPVVATVALRAPDGTSLGTLALHAALGRTLSSGEDALLADLALVAERDLAARRLATCDDLTGLANRRGVLAAASDALAICRRQRMPATMRYFDLDGCKAINDTRGHAAGDHALRVFAGWLRATFRASDVIGRLGGDEFVVLATSTGAAAIAGAVARLRDGLAASPEALLFSVGVVEFDPQAHGSVDALLAHADAAMFSHKATQRGARVVPLVRRGAPRKLGFGGVVRDLRERRAVGRTGR